MKKEEKTEKKVKTTWDKIKFWGKIIMVFILIFLAWFLFGNSNIGNSEKVNSINTKFNPINSHSIETDKFIDPEISNAVCFLTRAKTGGIKGSVGLAEDLSDMSLACTLMGDKAEIKNNKFTKGSLVAYKESRNVTFKKLQVIRNYDEKTNTVYYVAYSDKILDGDSANATAVLWLGQK